MFSLGFFVFALAAAATPASGPQATLSPVQIPAYEDVPNAKLYASAEEYGSAKGDPDFALMRLRYLSDGLNVSAYVYRPKTVIQPLPVIIFNRGSWTWPGFAGELLTMAHRLALSGYVVVAPLYRGSGGDPGRDEMGGKDVDDLLNLLPAIRGLNFADSDQVYLYGESRGGMMVYQALREGFPAKAAAVVGAFTDLGQLLDDPQWAGVSKTIWPDIGERGAEIIRRRSALEWADKIDVPILILHGSDDEAVPPRHAIELAERLSKAGKKYQLLIAADRDHTFSEAPAERDRLVLDWFERYRAEE